MLAELQTTPSQCMLVAPAVGYWLDFSHGAYGPLFIIAGSSYLVALAIIHLLVPRIENRAGTGGSSSSLVHH